MTTIAPHSLDQLRRTLTGEVILPGEAGYDDARRLWNAIHDRRPAVIARATSAEEVATSIAFARDHDLELQVRSGGHSARDIAGGDGGFLVDMSAMRGVSVDPERRVARVAGGALLGELDVAAQAYGLVCPVGVVGHTGCAGLTLGGGTGRLQRHFGLTIDNLQAVELVTADGRLVRASDTEEPELFWALRGAGWNFGVATAFEFRLQPFGPDLHRGVRAYRASQVHEIYEQFRSYAATAPDAVSVIFGIGRAGGTDQGYPDDVAGRPIAYVTWNHSGAAEDAERDMAALGRSRKAPAASRTSTSRPPTTSRSRGAPGRTSPATTRTASVRRRWTRSWSSWRSAAATPASPSPRWAARSAACRRTRWRTPAVPPPLT
jgi:FAD/FMN-containing dehydrogenase